MRAVAFRHQALLIAAALLLPGLSGSSRAENSDTLEICDGERIMLIGDLMHGPRYAQHPGLRDPELLPAYFLSRFAARNVTFVKIAEDHATTAQLLGGLDSEVLSWQPTLVIVDRGVYDVAAQFRKPKPDFGVYKASMSRLVSRLRAGGARVVLCSPTPKNNGSTPENLLAPNDGIAGMVQDARAIAAANEAHFVDVFTPLLQGAQRARRTQPPQNFMAMQYHFFEAAHLVLTDTILAGLRAPGAISSATVDAGALTAQTTSCAVTDIAREDGTLRFVRKDVYAFMPMPAAAMASLGTRYNRATLAVSGLAPGSYAIVIDGAKWNTFTHEQLSTGVNLGSSPSALYAVPHEEFLKGMRAVCDLVTALAEVRGFRLPDWIRQPDFEVQRETALDARLRTFAEAQAQLRSMFQPKPHLFEITPVPAQ